MKNLSDEEKKIAMAGLNITGYAGKWKDAQRLVTHEGERVFEDERHLLPYWERVRLRFLELGGEYIGQGGR